VGNRRTPDLHRHKQPVDCAHMAPRGRYMPAVYKVDEKGNEALMNTNVIDGNS
jgi:hypothetical protein